MTKAKSNREAGAKPASAPATDASDQASGETAASTSAVGDQDSGAPATGDAPTPPASDTAGETTPPTPPADDQGYGSPVSAETSAGDVSTATEIAGSDDEGEDDPIGDLGGRVILVRSTSDRGRRRAGLAFGPTPTTVQVDELTDEQIASLLADPQLIISLDD